MYSIFFRNVLFPVMESYQGTSIQRNLKYLQKTQWLSEQEIEAIQTKKLKSVIRHAYDNVPYYREVFHTIGLHPDDIKTEKDLVKLPVLTKDIIRKKHADLLATNIPKKNIIRRSSSGSTGEPLIYFVDKEAYSFGWAQTFRCWSWAGYSLGDSYVKIARPRPGFTKKLQDLLMRCTSVSAFEIDEKNSWSIHERMRKAKPVILRGFPSSVFLLARLIDHAGLKDINVKAVMTTGDALLPEFRTAIENVFHCRVFDAYGGEGTAVAFECEEHNGYHIAQEGVMVEYLDSSGELSNKDYGELCITNLTNYAMPLIRYNIQDIGTRSDESCSCGRNLARLKSIEGRTTDIIITPAEKLLTVHFFSNFLTRYPGIVQYQVVQEKIDGFMINLVKDASYREENTVALINDCKSTIGEDLDIRIDFVEEIPLLKSGKRRFVISKVPLVV
jgi:phenylacetate-CoA ligase